MSWANYKDKLDKYFWFSKEEWKAFVITVLIGALIYSWNSWGDVRFDAAQGAKSLIIAIILVGVAVFVHHAVQRMFALTLGFRAEHRLWWYGLVIGLILAMLSRGSIVFFAASSTLIHLMPIHRLGAFRYGPNLATFSKISFMGPFASATLAWITSLFMAWEIVGQVAGHRFFMLNAMFAVMNLLPIPPLDGSRIFYSSRPEYIFIFLSFLAFAVIGYTFQVYSATAAFLVGVGGSLLITLLRKG